MKPLSFLMMKNGIIKKTQPAPGIQPSGVVVFLDLKIFKVSSSLANTRIFVVGQS